MAETYRHGYFHTVVLRDSFVIVLRLQWLEKGVIPKMITIRELAGFPAISVRTRSIMIRLIFEAQRLSRGAFVCMMVQQRKTEMHPCIEGTGPKSRGNHKAQQGVSGSGIAVDSAGTEKEQLMMSKDALLKNQMQVDDYYCLHPAVWARNSATSTEILSSQTMDHPYSLTTHLVALLRIMTPLLA